MAVFTPLDKAQLVRILEGFGIDRMLSVTSTRDGIENSNYFVRAEGREEAGGAIEDYVLTLMEPMAGRTRSAALMILVLNTCRRNGLDVPSLVRTTHGGFVVLVGGRPALLAPRIAGEHLRRPAPHHCAQIGIFLGKLHLATKAISQSAAHYWRDSGWLRDNATKVSKNLGWSNRRLLEQEVCHAASMLARKDVNSLPRGLIHGDLFRDNALFIKDKLSGVLDFHHTGRGYWVYDIAVALNDWCLSEGSLDQSRGLALLRGYHSIRRLEEAEFAYLHGFLRYAALSFWLSRYAASLNRRERDAGSDKDPSEFRNLVIEHLRSPWRPESSELATV